MRRESLDDWQMWMQAAGLSPRTIDSRVKAVAALCRHQGVEDPVTITTRQIVGWLACRNSAWTRHSYWARVSAWCQWLTKQGLRDDNPMEKITRPRAPRAVPRPTPESVVALILADPGGYRTYAYMVLAAYAGLRVHEIAKVRGEDVDREAGWLYVVGKGGQHAALPMHTLVARLAHGMPESGWWFPGVEHGHVRASTVTQVVGNAMRRHGYAYTAHQLRHHFGTHVLRASRDLRVTQELMRHASPASTAIYTQVSSADKVAAVNSLRWTA